MSARLPDRRSPSAGPALAALLLLLAGCDASTTSTAPDGGPLRLVPSGGVEQRGLPNLALPLPLVVRVVDSEGRPSVGTTVRFRAGAGSGTVETVLGITNAQGAAVGRWILGTLPNQEAIASVQGGTPDITFTASLLPREEADLVLVSGQGSGDASVVAYDGGAFDSQETYRAAVRDSLVLLPFSTPSLRDEVAAFARGRPPALIPAVRWTAGRRDTLSIAFREPVAIPITIWIVQGPFEAMEKTAQDHVRYAQQVWAESGMGVRFSEVEIRDATDHPRAAEFRGINPALCNAGVKFAIGSVPRRVNVYYVGGLATFAGYACGDHVLMAELSGRYRTLLAHEIGHTFGLSHDQFGGSNVMNPNPGTQFTAGQVFHAHFQGYSTLNRIYGVQPKELLRDCRYRTDGSPAPASRACMPASFDLQ